MCTIFFSLLQGHSETRSVLQYSPDQWFNTVGHQCESWQRVVSQLCVCRLPQEGRYHCQKVSVSHVQNLDWNLKALVSKFNMEKNRMHQKRIRKKNISIFLGPQTLTILSTPKQLVIFILYLVFSQIWFMSPAATWKHDPLTWTSQFWHLCHTFFSEENIVMQSLGWGVRSWIIHVYEESQ